MLQASLAQLIQVHDLWSVKTLPDAVLELMEDVPLANGTQYHVPLIKALNSGEHCLLTYVVSTVTCK
jgi:hypothetical protein